jgi:hypothetical protein
MRRPTLLAAMALGLAGPLAAQNGREAFIQPDTAYDAIHAVQRDAFLVLRDSTSSITGAGAKLMSDLTSSSSLPWMQARARAVAAACGRSESPLAAARAVTTAGDWPLDLQKQAQANLLKAMKSFSTDLVDCKKRWTALAADTSQASLRENIPYQMKLLQDNVDQFNRTARMYLQYINVKLAPTGTPKP